MCPAWAPYPDNTSCYTLGKGSVSSVTHHSWDRLRRHPASYARIRVHGHPCHPIQSRESGAVHRSCNRRCPTHRPIRCQEIAKLSSTINPSCMHTQSQAQLPAMASSRPRIGPDLRHSLSQLGVDVPGRADRKDCQARPQILPPKLLAIPSLPLARPRTTMSPGSRAPEGSRAARATRCHLSRR